MTDLSIQSSSYQTQPRAGDQQRSPQSNEAANEFEAMFLAQTFEQMFSTVDMGSFSGGHAEKMWRSVLSQEYADAVAESGTTGISRSISGMLSAYDTQTKSK